MGALEPGPLPPLVRSRVAVVRRGLLSVRWFQGVCLGVAAFLLALAIGVQEQRGELGLGLCFVAGVNGLLVSLWWGLLHRRSTAQVARDVDRAMNLNGSLFTAWEAEGQSNPTSIARRLGQKVAGRVTPRKMMRAILPASLPMLAIPFAALGVLLVAREESRIDPIQADLDGLVEEMQRGIGAVTADGEGAPADSAETLTALERQELQQLMRATRELGEELKEGTATDEEAREIAERLAELGDSLAQRGSEELREGLDRTQAALDAARMSMEGGGARGQEAPESGDSSAATASSPGSGLASSGRDGRMGGPNSLPTRATAPGQPGVLGSPSWPRAYDGIVRRWLEATR